ncbi:hypothetical protein ACS0TY_033144 [Phlomoides rotata]
MEVENMSSTVTSIKEEEDDARLPGFRFHPTDEELVGFYLRRKVEKRPISIELIKQADIYKYDPWDLPKSNTVGDKEWYFYCKRGRKYKNSIRPNRVTGSGFWKATGIDKPIYSSSKSGDGGRECIGLKKSLVYYRGSAGKGTKTDWMMHEFRLPTTNDKSTKHMDAKTIAQEAEVWTLCRILKRDVSYKKCVPDWREMAAAKRNTNRVIDAGSQTCSVESCDPNAGYISFSAPAMVKQTEKRSSVYSSNVESLGNQHDHEFVSHYQAPVATSLPSYICGDINELLRYADWEDLRSIVDCATTTTTTPLYL